MPLRPARPISRARAASCALVNLAATPGLGSLMARRYFAGTAQLLIALAGFGLILGWMLEYFHRVFLQQLDEPVPPDSSGWMGKWGLICFVAAWLWSLATSVSLWLQAKSSPPTSTELPGQPPKLS